MRNQNMTRREMLGILAAGGMAMRVAHLKAAAPGFKIGACDWTIGKRSDPTALDLAKRLGLDGVMADMGSPSNDFPLRHPEVQKSYREAVARTRLAVSSLALGVLNEIPLKNDSRAEQWVSDSIEVCTAMKLKVVLVPFFGKADLRGDKPGTDAVVAAFKRLAPKAQKAGVILGVESWLSADQHVDILNRVSSPAVQVYYDMGNSQKAGYDICKEIRFLGKRICEFHAKDYDDLYGKGSMNFPAVRKAMDDIGYRGWMQIEGVKTPLGVEESVRYDLNYLRGVFPPTV
ncbi:MAG TPA: sugar phosphate isomerase/epimerase family protein [Terriglobia bacterium]|nr:sugar phosphate isomerase/epimerase family protein [Terriglobia bacterium]